MASKYDNLVPPEEWVTHPDPEGFDQACPCCSALVEHRAFHRAYHLAMVTHIETLEKRLNHHIGRGKE